MSAINDYLTQLEARLPELEWKLSALDSTALDFKKIPRGLFRASNSATAQACVNEIKEDLSALKEQTTIHSIQYLANLISQKISVLVRVCRLNQNTRSIESFKQTLLQKISTRKQWLETMYADLDRLKQQKRALRATLVNLGNSNTSYYLTVQSELSEVTRRLTTVNENLARYTPHHILTQSSAYHDEE